MPPWRAGSRRARPLRHRGRRCRRSSRRSGRVSERRPVPQTRCPDREECRVMTAPATADDDVVVRHPYDPLSAAEIAAAVAAAKAAAPDQVLKFPIVRLAYPDKEAV